MSLEHVKAFYNRLADDEVFSAQIRNVQSKDECSQIVKAAGYRFTPEEFETYTAQILELDAADNDRRSLDEKELTAVVGGVNAILWKKPPYDMPLYGVVPPRPEEI